MKNYLGDGWSVIKKVLYEDQVNLYLTSFVLIVSIIDFSIWFLVLSKKDLFLYDYLGIYPIRYLVIILVLNTVLGLFSYDKEKEISHLLFGANVLVSLFVLALEIFYLSSLK